MAKDVTRTIRLAAEELAEIERLAEQRYMSVSAYLRAAALGQLGDAGVDLEQASELEKVKERLSRLEKLAYGID